MNQTQLKTKKKKIGAVKLNFIFLIISMTWSLLQCAYNIFAGLEQDVSWSWWFDIAIWYGTIFIVKAIVVDACNKMFKKQKHPDFRIVAIVYLFISSTQIFIVAINSTYLQTVFFSKIHKFDIISIVANAISSGIFISSWFPVKKSKFTLDEYKFLKCKEYVGRSEGFVTVLLVTLNILIIVRDYGKVSSINQNVLMITYLVIGITCAIYSFSLAIWLCKTKRFDAKQ